MESELAGAPDPPGKRDAPVMGVEIETSALRMTAIENKINPETLTGMLEEEAKHFISLQGLRSRVTRRKTNGIDEVIRYTMELRGDRVDLHIEDGLVVKAKIS